MEGSIVELDKKILNVLKENSHQSLRQVASKVKSSVATVMNHIRKLEKMELIRKYTVKLDYQKLGYEFHVLINIKVAHGKYLDLQKSIVNHPNIQFIFDLTGDFDSILIARFKTRAALSNFIRKLQKHEFVERTKTNLILNTVQEKSLDIS